MLEATPTLKTSAKEDLVLPPPLINTDPPAFLWAVKQVPLHTQLREEKMGIGKEQHSP